MNTITAKPSSVFIKYAIPSVLGMLAISSASIIDGLFIGNYVGSGGLAAINLAIPIFSIIFGLALMLGIGSCVVSGKLLAEGKNQAASEIFSKTVVTVTLLSFFIVIALYFSLNSVLTAFGVDSDLHQDTTAYVLGFLPFVPFLMIGIVLDYFVKIDDRPNLAFWALLCSALVNIGLDWLFIVYFQQGLVGAAIATGLSQIVLIIVLLPHFFSPKAKINFVKVQGDWLSIIKAGSNGASEFINETSIGITALIFNYIMLQSYGVDGVAAFAVINYIIWFSIMISFGISDSLQPIISKNFGAKEPLRIQLFIKSAIVWVSIIGVILVMLLTNKPKELIDLFLADENIKVTAITLDFATYIWPLFIFSGISLVISAYFTAVHKPVPSATIALARSLILPIGFIYLLPMFWGNIGIYMAIPVSELVTMVLAIVLYFKLSPTKLIAQPKEL